MYRPTQKGMAFCRDILDPYEKMFPRRKEGEGEEGEGGEEKNKKNKKKEESSSSPEGNEKKNFNNGSLMLVLI
jgi:hypothetical protein